MPRRRTRPEEHPLTEREFEVLGHAALCIDGEFPSVDCRLLADLAGFQHAQHAAEHWVAFKKKIRELAPRLELDDITFRELQVAGYAWQCFPASKIPEVKPKRLVKLGLYESREKAAKAWDIITKKLHVLEEKDDAESAGSTPAASADPSAIVARNTPSKRKASQDGNGNAEAPAAKRRRAD